MNDGGPAFPQHDAISDNYVLERGMSLRDWFAGMAVRAFINQCDDDDDWGYLARKAYEMADAMLKEREK